MKKIFFSPIVITILLAILLIGFFTQLKYSKKITEIKNSNAEHVIQKATLTPARLQKILANNEKAQAEASTPNLLTAERIYTEEEIKNTTEIQFKSMLTETELRLPNLDDIKKIPPGALHHTPPLVLEAGRNLGALKEVFKFHPEYEELAIPFYEKCAHAIDHPTTVRALCLTNLIEISKKHHLPIDLKTYPKNIVKLTKLVTDSKGDL